MARPRGRFDEQKERCYVKFIALARPVCWASNEYLARELGCSVRQVTRYIAALIEEGRIIRNMKRYLKDGYKTRRFMYLVKKKVRGWAKPMYDKPPAGPSENRYVPPETVTPAMVAQKIVTPRWGRPMYEDAMPKPDLFAQANESLVEVEKLMAEEAARLKKRAEAEAQDPALAMKRMNKTMRAYEKALNIKLDVSHKIPQETD